MRLTSAGKHTSVARIPDDWSASTLKAKTVFISKGTTPTSVGRPFVDRGVHFVKIESITDDGHLDIAKLACIDCQTHALLKRSQLECGDVLFSIAGALGRTAIVPDWILPANTNQAVAFIRVGENAELDKKFLFYYLRSDRIRKHVEAITVQGAQANLSLENIRNLEIWVPRLSEQRDIATTLGDVDALFDALVMLITKKRDLKEAAMDQLLTGQRRLPGFAGVWETKRLGEIGSFSKGKGIRKDDLVGDGLPCVRYGELYTHHNDFVRKFFSFIPADVAKRSQRLRNGDLLFAGSGETAEEIGRCAAFLHDVEAYAGGDIVILTPIGQDSMYLGYLMNHASIVEQKARLGQGDAVVHISATNIAQLKARLPQKAEQTAIAAVLADMDAEIAVLEQRLVKTRALKRGLERELLTGRTRLV